MLATKQRAEAMMFEMIRAWSDAWEAERDGWAEGLSRHLTAMETAYQEVARDTSPWQGDGTALLDVLAGARDYLAEHGRPQALGAGA